MVHESQGCTTLVFGRTKYFLGEVVLTCQVAQKPNFQYNKLKLYIRNYIKQTKLTVECFLY